MKNRTEFIRVEKTNNFSIIHNGFLRRDDLSWKAKGILAYILSLPDDWNINLNEIMRHATEGETAFRSGWKELTDAGYVERYAVHDDVTKKITHWETVVKENVDITMKKPHTENPHVDNLDVGNLDVGNNKLLSTYSTKDLTKQSTNNTKSNIPAKAEPSNFSDHSDYKETKQSDYQETSLSLTDEYTHKEKNNNNKLSDTELKDNFESLWKIYPNKKGKQRAFNHYKKAIKKGVTDEEIKKGIEGYNQEILNKRTAKGYIKHGSNWFGDWNWEDDYEIKNNNDIDQEPNMDWLSTDNIFG